MIKLLMLCQMIRGLACNIKFINISKMEEEDPSRIVEQEAEFYNKLQENGLMYVAIDFLIKRKGYESRMHVLKEGLVRIFTNMVSHGEYADFDALYEDIIRFRDERAN
jgi:hypothetical protein